MSRFLFLMILVGALGSCKPDKVTKPKSVEPTSIEQPVLRLLYSLDLGGVAQGSRSAAVDSVVQVIRKRLDAAKLQDVVVDRRGESVIVDLPELSSLEIRRVEKLVAPAARLEFKFVDSAEVDGVIRHEFMKRVYAASVSAPAALEQGIGVDVDQWMQGTRRYVDYYLRASDRRDFLAHPEADAIGCVPDTEDPGGRHCFTSGRQVLDDYLARLGDSDPRLQIDKEHKFGYERVIPIDPSETPYWRSYYLQRAVLVSGADVEDASVFFDEYSNRPSVLIKFGEEGRARFSDGTGDNIGHKLAISIDGVITSAPVVQSQIPGGAAAISLGTGSPESMREEASGLAALLESGALPSPLRLESSTLLQ